jgi:uncharacterized protein (DUF983 family)
MTGDRQFGSKVSRDTGIIIIDGKRATCPKCGGDLMTEVMRDACDCWMCGKYTAQRKLVLKEQSECVSL